MGPVIETVEKLFDFPIIKEVEVPKILTVERIMEISQIQTIEKVEELPETQVFEGVTTHVEIPTRRKEVSDRVIQHLLEEGENLEPVMIGGSAMMTGSISGVTMTGSISGLSLSMSCVTHEREFGQFC